MYAVVRQSHAGIVSKRLNGLMVFQCSDFFQ